MDFHVRAARGGARTGVVRCPNPDTGKHFEVPTPTCLVPTQRGGVPCLSVDILREVVPANHFLQVGAWDILDLPGWQPFHEKTGKGLAAYWAVDEYPLFLTVRPSHRPMAATSTGVPRNPDAMQEDLANGRRPLTLADFESLARAVRPAVITQLYDFCGCPPPKRRRAAIERTNQWRTSLLANKEVASCMFTVATPKLPTRSREGVETETADEIEVSSETPGIALTHFGAGEAEETRYAALAQVNKTALDRPVFMSGAFDTPVEVLDYVSRGVDIFEAEAPVRLAFEGLAWVYSLDSAHAPLGIGPKVNLRDPQFETDTDPLLTHCACYTCKRHSKAYLHHLFNTHEMTGELLLVIHNLHHHLSFFASIRRHLEAGSFDEFKLWVLKQFSTSSA